MMIGLALAVMLSGAAHYPADVQPLIRRANELSGQFVNAPETPQTNRARRAYKTVTQQLKAKGWCWGSRNRDASDAEMVWLPCRQDRYGQ